MASYPHQVVKKNIALWIVVANSRFHSKPSAAAAREHEVSEAVIISPREQCQRRAGRLVLEGTNVAENADAQLDKKEIDPAGRKRRGLSDQGEQKVRQLTLNRDYIIYFRGAWPYALEESTIDPRSLYSLRFLVTLKQPLPTHWKPITLIKVRPCLARTPISRMT